MANARPVLHIGAVMGAGYVSREGTSALLRSLDRAGWLWLSERDFHQSFAEAILLGRSSFKQNCEVLAGVRRVEPDEGADRQWFDNPKFQHCAAQQGSVVSKKSDITTAISLKSQLLAASTEKDAYEILKGKIQILLLGCVMLTLSRIIPFQAKGCPSTAGNVGISAVFRPFTESR